MWLIFKLDTYYISLGPLSYLSHNSSHFKLSAFWADKVTENRDYYNSVLAIRAWEDLSRCNFTHIQISSDLMTSCTQVPL